MLKKLVIGHRGAPRMAHENTLESFAKAVELGGSAVELDVRKTKDNVLVCFHDQLFENELIDDISFSHLKELASLHNFSVPVLAEALEMLVGKAEVHIEIKVQGIEREVINIARQHLPYSQYYIISFHFFSLKKIKQIDSQVRTGLILGWRPKRFILAMIFFVFWRSAIDYIDLFCLHWQLYSTRFASFIPKHYPIIVWTVDDKKNMDKFFKDSRVIGITSNLPDVAILVRDQIL